MMFYLQFKNLIVELLGLQIAQHVAQTFKMVLTATMLDARRKQLEGGNASAQNGRNSLPCTDIKNGSYCYYVRCPTYIVRVGECLGLEQAQLATMHSWDFSDKSCAPQ